MSAGPSDIRDLELEQFVLGELPAARAAEIESRVSEPDVAARIARIRESDRQILDEHPPGLIARSVRERAGVGRLSMNGRQGWVIGIGMAAAAALLLVLVPMPETGPESAAGAPTEGEVRSKGVMAPELVVFARGESGTRRLGPGDAVEDGDVLQVGYLAGKRHGFIGLIDGSGAVLVLHPDGGTDRLSGGENLLPKAVTGRAGGFVRVIMVQTTTALMPLRRVMPWGCWSMPRIRPATSWRSMEIRSCSTCCCWRTPVVEPTRPVRGPQP